MNRPKSLAAVADHRLRRAGLQVARLAGWWLRPQRWPMAERYVPERHGRLEVLVHEVTAPIRREDGFADPALEAGKRKNLGLAAPAFDGLVVRPDRPLSFWRTLGRASQSRGYTWGRELRGGCVVPAIAGGLCLLSNALFELAVRAGWRILERHGHSLEVIPPQPGTLLLDATVAWPDVDLVVAPPSGPARLSIRVDEDTLRVAAFAARAPEERIELTAEERIEQRGPERVRSSRVVRRRSSGDGAVLATDVVAHDERRILATDELHETCLSCDEHRCRDRPPERVIATLRTLGRKR